MSRMLVAILGLTLGVLFDSSALADQPTLLEMAFEWKYPDAKIGRAQMSDGATVDRDGNRKFASFIATNVMKTEASVEEVLKYYREKLAPAKIDNEIPSLDPGGRSVFVSNDTQGRSFELHTILVNTEQTSTTLVISRAKGDKTTQIAWKHYRRFAFESEVDDRNEALKESTRQSDSQKDD